MSNIADDLKLNPTDDSKSNITSMFENSVEQIKHLPEKVGNKLKNMSSKQIVVVIICVLLLLYLLSYFWKREPMMDNIRFGVDPRVPVFPPRHK